MTIYERFSSMPSHMPFLHHASRVSGVFCDECVYLDVEKRRRQKRLSGGLKTMGVLDNKSTKTRDTIALR